MLIQVGKIQKIGLSQKYDSSFNSVKVIYCWEKDNVSIPDILMLFRTIILFGGCIILISCIWKQFFFELILK